MPTLGLVPTFSAMYFYYSPKSSVLLIFFVHLVFLGGLLLWIGFRNNLRSSNWLGLFSGLAACYIAPFMLGYANWYAQDGYREFLFYMPFQQVLLLGPVLYFYVRQVLEPQRAFSKRDWLHLIPAGLYLVYALVIWLWDSVLGPQVFFYANNKDKDFDLWYQVVGFASLTGYFLLSLVAFRGYRRWSYNSLSYADEVQFRWLHRFLWAFVLMLSLRLLFFFTNPEWGEFGRKFWYYVSFSVLVYWLVTLGFGHAWRWSRSLGTDKPTLPPKTDNSEIPKSEPVQLPHLEEWKARLETYMIDQQAFLNPALTLSEVAEGLDTHTKQISQVVNQGYHTNFNDFVNDRRIAHVVDRLKAGDHHTMTLLGLALECGFNSKSTFNRAFKKSKGQTPKQFLEKIGV